ncbi:MAG: hypothetical protein K2X57_09075, partial [Xanthobacteraceae bacterium]|nr:hypothetical protein [Xanthobacteraceae bacterium]
WRLPEATRPIFGIIFRLEVTKVQGRSRVGPQSSPRRQAGAREFRQGGIAAIDTKGIEILIDRANFYTANDTRFRHRPWA